jgi:predicted nucleic acid-binding protein
MRVYLDTSVFGGCFDEEFRRDSDRVMQALSRVDLIALVSDVTVSELAGAPDDVIGLLSSLPPAAIERVETSEEALVLRDAYLAAGIVGARWSNDALHVALATVSRADAIASWNFRHIVRLDRIRLYNAANLTEGYGLITILSPKEVTPDDSDD